VRHASAQVLLRWGRSTGMSSISHAVSPRTLAIRPDILAGCAILYDRKDNIGFLLLPLHSHSQYVVREYARADYQVLSSPYEENGADVTKPVLRHFIWG
jgi:hypothetical protein